MKQGVFGFLSHRFPDLSAAKISALSAIWLLAMLGLALFGMFEPRADFHYLAM
ncbi:Protein of unknown function [Magnetospira sp. QH-2]|nr:Protein of unknown function [Magnetospira sp. QH-2]